jgi:hypothetical protein
MIVVGLLLCSLILAYFTVLAPPVEMPDLTRLKAAPAVPGALSASPGPITPAPATQEPATRPPEPQPAPGSVSAAPPPVEFGTGKADVLGPKTEFGLNPAGIRAVLPSARLAPDMFAYATLPYDAPLAEFPLVLVGQKYLEWYKTTSEPIGVSAGIGSASIYGRPPTPPGTPPTPPGPPPGPPPKPPKPPKPPPEVSTSGI